MDRRRKGQEEEEEKRMMMKKKKKKKKKKKESPLGSLWRRDSRPFSRGGRAATAVKRHQSEPQGARTVGFGLMSGHLF